MEKTEQAGALMTDKILSLRSLAHIGDAVYEVFAREITVKKTENPKQLHRLTVSIVNAEFQAYLLENVQDFLNDDEKEITRRARNMAVTTARRTNQTLHRLSTAFEVLIGYLYMNDKTRLENLYLIIKPLVEERLLEFND